MTTTLTLVWFAFALFIIVAFVLALPPRWLLYFTAASLMLMFIGGRV